MLLPEVSRYIKINKQVERYLLQPTNSVLIQLKNIRSVRLTAGDWILQQQIIWIL